MVEAAIFHGAITEKEDDPHPNELAFSELRTDSQIKVQVPDAPSGRGTLTVMAPFFYGRDTSDTGKVTYGSRFEVQAPSKSWVSFTHQPTGAPNKNERMLWMDPANCDTMVCYGEKASETKNGRKTLTTAMSVQVHPVTHTSVNPHPIGWQ